MKIFSLSLMIFRRDMRLDDNTAYLKAAELSDRVIPVFVCDPRQLENNPYRSDASVQFMLESLRDLDEQIQKLSGRLFVLYGRAHEVIRKILKDHPVQAVFVNRDYTPFSIQRDLAIAHECESSGVKFYSCGDALLHEPEDIHKGDGGSYTVYTPFAKKALACPVHKPQGNPHKNFWHEDVKGAEDLKAKNILSFSNPSAAVKGGRTQALKILSGISRFNRYDAERNFPSRSSTTRLSAHHKFGTVSVREVYHAVSAAFDPAHTLIRELLWRDFFTHVGFHHPFVLGESFQERYRNIRWENDERKFQAWCEGRTGFPMVDAGMRELNATGFMHNRVRMITASFLVKDLHIDWRRGEKYFAQKLVDYDPYVNNGNWQWAASTGCDAQPYFRIFNPWLQQKRFDPDAEYIKEWIPELRGLDAKSIHALVDSPPPDGYLSPIVNHHLECLKAKRMFSILNDPSKYN